MEVNFLNTRSVLLLVCLMQGLIFVALLSFRSFRGRSVADGWLAILLVLLCLSLLTPFVGFANLYDVWPWLSFVPFHFAYSYGVCVYLYTLSLTDSDNRLALRDLPLFIPTALYVLFRLTLFAQPTSFKNWFSDTYYAPYVSPFVVTTELVWNVAFLCLSLVHFRRYRKWLDGNYSEIERLKFDWLRNFLYIFTLIVVAGALFDLTDSFVVHLSYIQYFYFEMMLAFATYYIAVAGYLRSERTDLHFAPETAPPGATRTDGSARRSSIADGEIFALKEKLRDLMESSKYYLEPELTLSELSRHLGVNTSVLSQIINQGFSKNFNDFVNEYRVNEVKARLVAGAAKNTNLLTIAFDCGFNSKATFNRVFKKFTGSSPKLFESRLRSSLKK